MAAGTGLDAGQDGWGACRTGRGHAHACPASAGSHADAAVDRAAAAGLPRPGSGRGGGAAVEVKDLAFFVLAASAVWTGWRVFRPERSEARSVGIACGSTCRARGEPCT